jgi:hypothetical protein
VLDGRFLGGETRFGFGTMIIRGARKVIAVRVGIPFNRKLLWALTIVVGKPHMGAASKEERTNNNNNCSQFFFLSAAVTSSKASSGKV